MPNRVGQTSLYVPPVGLGTAHIVHSYGEVPEAQAIDAIRYALDRGITFIDTAPLYGATVAETRLGMALQGIPRERYVLETKVGQHGDSDPTIPRRYDYSRDAVLRDLEGSLKRLRIDYVDIVLIHDPDNHFREALDHAFPTLAELRSQGVIKAVGAGMNQWEMEVEFARNADFDCFLLAGRYTLLEQGALGALDFFYQRQISLFAGGIYNSGVLARGVQQGNYDYAPVPPHIAERVNRLEAVCRRHNVPLKAAAAQFPGAHPAVASSVFGMASRAEIDDNLAMLDYAIPAALWDDLRADGLLDPAAPVPKK